MSLGELRESEYFQRLHVTSLRHEVFGQNPMPTGDSLLERLANAELKLGSLTRQRVEAEAAQAPHSVELRGPLSTGLEVEIDVRMSQVPTAIYHLLDPADQPLVSCRIRNLRPGIRRLRVISFIEGYSARAIETVEVESRQEAQVHLLPPLLSRRVHELTEVVGASLNVLVEDLAGQVELHITKQVWLLARTTAALAVRDAATGVSKDVTKYLGAFVTPNAPEVRTFLRTAADHHPERTLLGYQSGREAVEPQVRAIFGALKEAGITYVSSVLASTPEEGVNQRVRLPRESLSDRQANCIDGTVLMASMLEAASLSPALVIIPGHALLGWEKWNRTNEWQFLETTMIGSSDFETACATAERTVSTYRSLAEDGDDPFLFRLWPVRKLRTTYGIFPME